VFELFEELLGSLQVFFQLELDGAIGRQNILPLSGNIGDVWLLVPQFPRVALR